MKLIWTDYVAIFGAAIILGLLVEYYISSIRWIKATKLPKPKMKLYNFK